MSLPLQGQIIFVTGASRGIGRACAIAFSQLGGHCILSGRTQNGLIETDDLIRAQGGQATLLPLDLGQHDQIDNVGPSIAQRFGRLDIWLHAAFHPTPLMPLVQLPDAAWEKNIAVNLTGCWHLIRTLSPLLNQAPQGHAIFLQNMASTEAFWGPIAAIQAALQNLIECWKKEISHLSPLQIHSFKPVPTATRLRSQFFPAEKKEALALPETIAQQIVSLIIPS